ncbi:toxin-antitoxin system YwqK family antitoxin [Ancylomarina sp.]|uniref:toxin-antitoxin system YwqK family antitoxin n=1 Tax=Ancylomarina sp. TaxID=1970196 RepID=UPI003568529C
MRYTLLVLSILILSSCDFIIDKFAKKNDLVEQSYSVDSSSTDSKLINGEVRYKFPSGKLKSIVTYKDNKKIGVSHSFYETGEKQYEIPYVDGQKHGEVKWFYKSGKLYRSTSYIAGAKHGPQKKYWESGKIKSQMDYMDNMMCSGLKEFTNRGKQKTEPQIVVHHVNLLRETNMYHLELSLNKKFKNVQFYIGELVNGKCLPVKVNSFMSELETKKGKAIFKFSVPKGNSLNRDIPIVAVVKTPYQNHYILSTKTNVSVRNPN